MIEHVPDVLIGFGAGVLIVAGAELLGAFKGIKGAACKALNLYAQYQTFLFILSLFFLIPKLLNTAINVKERTFQLIKLPNGSNLMIVKRAKVDRYDSSFDDKRPFQYHIHEGKVSIYVQFNNFIVFESEMPLTTCDAWRGNAVKETPLTSNILKRRIAAALAGLN